MSHGERNKRSLAILRGLLQSLIKRRFSTVPRRLHASSVARVPTAPGQLFIPGTCLHWQHVGRGHFTIWGSWGKHDSLSHQRMRLCDPRERAKRKCAYVAEPEANCPDLDTLQLGYLYCFYTLMLVQQCFACFCGFFLMMRMCGILYVLLFSQKHQI